MLGQKENKKAMRPLVLTLIFILNITVLLSMVACSDQGPSNKTKYQITIAQQYGLPYAPLQVVKELGLIEKNLVGVKVNWKQLGNTAAIREAMLAGELDAGFVAIPPFLIGWDKDMDWRIACGLSTSPVGLVTYRDDIQSIKDFTTKDRIALPQPGSIQHILLSMACEKLFNDSQKLDNLLVTMAHPDGMNALLARREVTAHFTTPPYLFRELESEGMKQILDGQDAMGEEFTFIVGVTTVQLYKDKPEVYKAFTESIGEAIEYMNDKPEQTAAMLATAFDMEQSEVTKYLNHPKMKYSLEVRGVMTFAEFMQRNGYISKSPANADEVIW